MVPLGPVLAPRGPALLPGDKGSIWGQSTPSPPGTAITPCPAHPRRGI